MDRLKSVSKSGWHPGSSSEPSYAGASNSRSSSTTSRLRKNFKGFDQVAGWMGKGESGTDDGPVNVRPVSALRDPASFGPPPKRISNAGASSDGFVSQANGEDRGHEDESAEKYSPPKPYRVNTTGLSTDTLPLPPKRPNTSIGSGDETRTSGNRPPPIPPRLTPRGESALPAPRDVVDMKTGSINVATIGRLGKAGISVPGFNMTPTTAPTEKPPLPSGPRPSASMNNLGDHASDPRSTPSTGTTFAEKKAALATANSFYKNPSSVSFSDASAALKTGRNFQQRHGDQVASGYKKAQEMGFDKKIQGYGDLYASRNEGGSEGMATLRASLPPALPTKNLSPDLPSRPSGPPVPPAIISGQPGQGKKKPPPPPPKKKPTIPTPPKKQANNTSPHVNLASPPIIPRGTRPSPSENPTVLRNNGLPLQIFPELPSDLDLCISTAWFSKSPLKLPPPIDGIEEKIHMFTSSWERSASGRTKHTLILAIRWTINLSTTKIKITWDASAPSVTAKTEQKHFPPPSSPPRSEEWGDRIVDWVKARMGQQVGNGECWTLAADCFSSLKSEDEAIGSKKIMTAQGTSFGLCIFSHYPSLQHKPSMLSGLTLKPGDILQFRSARWIRRDSAGRVIFDMRAGAPEGTAGCKDHTAVIETVRYEPGGDIKVGVLQQNSNGVKAVTRGEYTLGVGEMVEGGVRVFRAVADGWVDLEAGW